MPRKKSEKTENTPPAGSQIQRKKPLDKLDKVTIEQITAAAGDIHGSILKGNKPELKFPLRTLSNVKYSRKQGYFEIGKQKKSRTLTVGTVKAFAQTLKMMELSKVLVETDDFATKRDAYY